jgi:hypothetical protein
MAAGSSGAFGDYFKVIAGNLGRVEAHFLRIDHRPASGTLQAIGDDAILRR